MKCRCGHEGESHVTRSLNGIVITSDYCREGGCYCQKFQQEEEKMKHYCETCGMTSYGRYPICGCKDVKSEEEKMKTAQDEDSYRSPFAIAEDERRASIAAQAEYLERQLIAQNQKQEGLRRRDLFERIVCAVASNPRMKTPLAIITLANELLARTLEKEER